MRHSRMARPQIQAGSMADIAFLMLIFFLVTATIPTDKGINRKLPRLCPHGEDCSVDIHQRNILEIRINGLNEIMIENELVTMDEIKGIAKAFVDNNGDKSCWHCNGEQDLKSSDNPRKAVISLLTHPQASYKTFIEVQDELTKAYYELRKTFATNILKKDVDVLTSEDIEQIKYLYPFIISEAETQR